MDGKILWQRRIPLRYKADVAVVGGGIAGVCAACAAAREGQKVVLIERFAVTGGNATIGGVGNWSGETKGQGAVFDEIIAEQEAFNAIAPYPGKYRHFCTNRCFDHEILALILQELLLKHGVTILLHTRFVDVSTDKKSIREIIICGNSGPEALSAEVFIDCSGGGFVAHQAGYRMVEADGYPQLPPSMMYFVTENDKPVIPQLPEGRLKSIRSREELPMVSCWPAGDHRKAIKVKIIGEDSLSSIGATRLEIKARRRSFEVLDYLQRIEKQPWSLSHLSPVTGLREGRRILGDYVLNVEDLRCGRSFDDAIARGYFFLDGMRPDSEKRTYFLSKEEQQVPPYQIPLRSLIARDGNNLMMAGRCFSSDQLALSSARVMTTCAMMGQAAGITAAIAVAEKNSVRNVDPIMVRQKLEDYGAII